MSSWDQDLQKDVGDQKEKKIGLKFQKKVALDNAKKHLVVVLSPIIQMGIAYLLWMELKDLLMEGEPYGKPTICFLKLLNP
jgi:hypothetical protein